MTTNEPDDQPTPADPPADPATPADPPVNAPATRTTRPAWLLPATTGVVGLVVGAGLTGAIMSARSSATESAALNDAVGECAVAFAPGIQVGDEGRSITFDMKGDEDTIGADISDIACLFTALDMPSAVSSHVDQTTSVDGRQTETWDNVSVSWSYHPDRGLDGVLTVADS